MADLVWLFTCRNAELMELLFLTNGTNMPIVFTIIMGTCKIHHWHSVILLVNSNFCQKFAKLHELIPHGMYFKKPYWIYLAKFIFTVFFTIEDTLYQTPPLLCALLRHPFILLTGVPFQIPKSNTATSINALELFHPARISPSCAWHLQSWNASPWATCSLRRTVREIWCDSI